MDRQHGGEHSRSLAVKYLHDNVIPRLRSAPSDHIGRDIFRAAAVLCELIGYVHDDSKHSLAQRYFIQSLRLAKAAGDTAYGSYVLSTMSHQALFLRRPKEARRLAQAACQTYRGTASPIVHTEASLLEAVAHAALGDRADSIRAISAAEHSFAAISESDVPPWASHWNVTLFNAGVARCWLTLGETSKARPYLTTAWEGSQQQSRRKIYAAGQLAKAAILEHDIEQSADYGLIAIESLDGLRSQRSLRVIADLHQRLSGHRTSSTVRAFIDRAKHVTGEMRSA